MNAILKNTLAIIVGLVVGSIVNMALVNIGPHLEPLPQGADVSNMDSLRESMALFSPVNFLFPFLAHALGTLVGAFVAAKLAASHHLKMAMTIGVLFLAGGISMVVMVGGPIWFNVADILLAYIPMAFLGAYFAKSKPSSSSV